MVRVFVVLSGVFLLGVFSSTACNSDSDPVSDTDDTGDYCGGPCPKGCYSPGNASCCEPPFCGGDCVGSPCC
jgi:hypothetical protein